MKRMLLALCLLSAPVAAAPDTSPLALPERRGIQAYQASTLPELQRRINEAAGFEVPLQVQWEAIAGRGQGASYNEPDYWTNVIFVPLAEALKEVGADDMGRKALKDSLKTVVVTYDKDTAPASAYERGVSFKGGVLTINFQPYANTSDVKDRTAAIRKVLEAGL